MKAERGRTKFDPIVITLETEEEAKLLWYLLHHPSDSLSKLVGYNIAGAWETPMFIALNNVYTPEKDC